MKTITPKTRTRTDRALGGNVPVTRTVTHLAQRVFRQLYFFGFDDHELLVLKGARIGHLAHPFFHHNRLVGRLFFATATATAVLFRRFFHHDVLDGMREKHNTRLHLHVGRKLFQRVFPHFRHSFI